jgi:integrase
MSYGMGRVYPRGKTFWVAYSVNGSVVRESAHTTCRAEAERHLARAILSHRGTTDGGIPKSQLTVAMLCERVLLKYRTKKQASLPTARGHAKAWCSALGTDTLLKSLSIEQLAVVKADWEDDEYSIATINRRLSFLQLGLRLVGAEPKLDLSELREGEDNVREAYITPAEFARIHAAAARRDVGLADYLGWLYLAGMRRGEAALLDVSWVDTHRWQLTIPGRVQKNRKDRVIPLVGPLRPVILARLARQHPDCTRLFHREGTAIGDIRKIWASCVAEAGLTDRRPHDLRRSASTNLLEFMTLKEAMQVTGHRTTSTFLRYQQADATVAAKLQAVPTPAWLQPRAA